MGRNSKFGSNANIQPTEISSGTQMFPNYLPRHPLYHRNLCPNSRVKTHPLGKIAASKPFPKVGKYQPGMDAHAFSKKIRFVVSAWEGYQQQGKGLVLVQNSDSSPPQIEYIPRQLLKTMRQYGLATEDIRAGQHD